MLLASEIKAAITRGDIKISDFRESALNPNSYNLRIGDVIKQVFPNASKGPLEYIDPDKPMVCRTGAIPEKGVILFPGYVYLVPTMEVVETNKYVPMITGRSSYGRLGMSAHREAGFGDIGFSGRWTLQIDVVTPTLLKPYREVCQVYFNEVVGDPDEMLYHGKYQHSDGAVESMAWKDIAKL